MVRKGAWRWQIESGDRQLADAIDSLSTCKYCIYNDGCRSGSDSCTDGIEKWLKKEHKDGIDWYGYAKMLWRVSM